MYQTSNNYRDTTDSALRKIISRGALRAPKHFSWGSQA